MSTTAYLNGEAREFEPGETILAYAERHLGKGCIPTLCHEPRLKPFGSCRVCSVEVALRADGPSKVMASCHTPVSAGWHIRTESARVQRLRRNLVELVVTDHPLDCLVCEQNGSCELQTVAARVGLREVRYPAGANHLDRPLDTSHPYLRTDLKRCINCFRCVRACDEIQGQFVLSMAGRGFDARIVKGVDTSFEQSPCVSCGACAQICPTAAISDVFQPRAAAAERRVRTVCSYCGVGCNLEVAVRGDEVLSIRAPEDAEVNAGHTCVKGRYAFGFYNHPDRLSSPLIRRDGKLTPATWEETFAYLADRLTAIREAHGPDAIAGISSSRCTNEENYLMQKLMRAVIGTNNIDGCARVCHAPTAYGMQQAFGTGAATNSIADLEMTDLVLVVGANPTSAHPVTGAKIKQAALRGVPLIVVDPVKTELARLATWHLQLRPGTNVALLNMMAHYILRDGLADTAFVAARCEGFEAYAAELGELDVAAMEAVCGVDRELVRAAAAAYAQAPRAMAFHGLGVTEFTQGSRAVMLIANLVMMTGNIGRPGVGMNPLRGQNNVQGGADMGVQPHQGAGYLDVTDPKVREHYREVYGREVPGTPGLKIPEMFEAAHAGDLKALWIIGEDVVQTDPNSDHVVACLERLELLVVQELFLSETARLAHVVLPGASFLEKNGTFTNGERRIQRVNRAVAPRPGSKPDGQILSEMMRHLGYDQADYDAAGVLAEVARAVPFFAGVTWERLGTNGLQWPVAPDGTDTKIIHAESFKRGKGLFHFFPFEESNELVTNSREFPLILTTVRSLEHYNCGTMTRRTANRRLMERDVVVIHPDDASARGIADGAEVRVRSARGETSLSARVRDTVKPGVLSTTFHFPEVLMNRITSSEHDEETLCPEYKVVAVEVESLS